MIHVTRKGTPRTSDSYHYQKTLESLLQAAQATAHNSGTSVAHCSLSRSESEPLCVLCLNLSVPLS